MNRISVPYEIVTVCDNTLTVLTDAIEHAISTDRSILAPGPNNSGNVSTNKYNISEILSVTQNTETPHTENNNYIDENIIRHVTQDVVTKYVVGWHGFLSEEDTIEEPHPLPSHIIVLYWKWQKTISHRGNHENASSTNATNPTRLIDTAVT